MVAVFMIFDAIAFFNAETDRERIYQETASDTNFNRP